MHNVHCTYGCGPCGVVIDSRGLHTTHRFDVGNSAGLYNTFLLVSARQIV